LCKYNEYIKQIYDSIEYLLKYYKVDNKKYETLSNKEIRTLYKKKVTIQTISSSTLTSSILVQPTIQSNITIQNNTKSICLRCGKDFNILAIHLKKKICKVKYLDIDGIEMINNYDEHYKKYQKILDAKYKCEYCTKFYASKQGYNKHKEQYCPNRPININENHINNFGEEVQVNSDDIMEIIDECLDKNRLDNILPMYVEKRWIDNENNRNINITDANRGITEVYENNKWEKRLLFEVIDMVRIKSIKSLTNYLTNVKEKLEDETEFKDDPRINKIIKTNHQIYNIENDPKLKKIINNYIKLVLINNRPKIRETKNKLQQNV
jgi:hypothetical protein